MRRRRRKGVFEKLEVFRPIYMRQEELDLNHLAMEYPGRSLVLELGCGRGQFLTTYGERRPEKLCIGVELKEEVLVKACQKAKDKHLTNIRFVLGDTERVVHQFEGRPLERVCVHFCDPWPKDRHSKRRLMHSRFLKSYAKALVPGGILQFKTDNQALFEFALSQFEDLPYRLTCVTLNVADDPAWQDNIMTEYEQRFSELGQPIYGILATRK